MAIADDIETIRMNLGDYLTPAIDTDLGDGSNKIFELTHKHLQDYHVYVEDTEQVEDTDYTMNEKSGTVVFSAAVGDGDEVRVEYNFAAFTDADLTIILTNLPNTNDATIKAIQMLLADAARRFDYTHGQTDVKSSQVFQHLKELLEIYQSNSNPLILDRGNEYYDREETTIQDDLTRDDGLGVEDDEPY
jgi:hypothetical protein